MIPESPIDPKSISPFNYDLKKLFPTYSYSTTTTKLIKRNALTNLVKRNWWHFKSGCVTRLVGLCAKLWMSLNRVQVHNPDYFDQAVKKSRALGIPLITISNHHSCLDDPLLFGTIKWEYLMSQKLMRSLGNLQKKLVWSLAAHDVCFTRPSHGILFSLGKIVPVVRGEGVYQDGVNFCLQRLQEGDWVHIFPEGKVNLDQQPRRFKWGIGRLAMDCDQVPIVLPIYHIGLDDVLPNQKPYVLRILKNVTVKFGKPLELEKVIGLNRKFSQERQRKFITDYLQESLLTLRSETELLHKSR